jgi:hypothetical protein
LLYVALGTACLLSACGGSTKTPGTTGKQFVVRPAERRVDKHGEVDLYFSRKKLGPAQAQKAMKEIEAFDRAHCPCTYEETRTGPRLLRMHR